MTNDAKLGLLAGVAGVVAAAVLYQPTGDAPPPPAQAAVSARPADPPRVAGAVPPPRPAAASRRPEIDARAVSRVADDED